ncbi:MAG TPA: Ig-like domain-containing protein, partial [Thermoanaerobaculia bacterium]|nr:Ig-like domain-containing protein [Thermoanaerobaculia bacterium]
APHGARVIVAGSGLDSPDIQVVFSSSSPAGTVAPLIHRETSLLELTVPPGAVSGPVRITEGSAQIAAFDFIVTAAPQFVRVATLISKESGKDLINEPRDVVVLPSGMLLVASRKNHQVQAFHPNGQLAWIAGTGSPGFSDGAASSARFREPAGIAVDLSRNIIYLADEGNHRLRKIGFDGTVSTLAGSGEPGLLNGTAANARFKFPAALAMDRSGNLYVADRGNHAIRKVSLDGSVTTVAGTGTPGFSNGAALSSTLNQPSGIAVTASGAILVSDTQNHAIRMMMSGQVTTVAGTGRPGFISGPAASALLKQPAGLALDEAGDLLIADTFNHAIRKLHLTESSSGLSNLSGAALPNHVDGSLTTSRYKFPEGIFANGSIYVADTKNDAIRVIYQSVEATAIYPGSAVPGETIRLFGTGFVAGATEITFGTLPAQEIAWLASTELRVRVPTGVTGPVNMVVSTPAGTSVLPFSAAPQVVALSIDVASSTLRMGQSVQLLAFVTYSDGSSADLTSDVQWTSSNSSVASVEGGLLVALSPGITTIAASYGAISASVSVTVTSEEPLPPDPASVAPSLDPSVPTTTFHSTRFLYQGPDPIQKNVTPEALAPERAMVVRGRLIRRDGQALPGVRISMNEKPELGETISRIDGRFDFVANGGGTEVLQLQKGGYIPADRQVTSNWGEDVHIGDIALIEYDAAVTQIRSSESAMQVARGSVMTDVDGTRRATVLFPAATESSMVLPSGTIQPMSSLDIRATEYTVGVYGRAAMPADLPPQSGYTYCVELSADEAVAAGATSVRFSRPVIIYVENFLGFPVGGAVPAGYYDRREAVWIPLDNGRVVKILGVELGLAYLDVDGNGIAADNAALTALGITDEEREKLAQMYGTGQSLWRTTVTHFSP